MIKNRPGEELGGSVSISSDGMVSRWGDAGSNDMGGHGPLIIERPPRCFIADEFYLIAAIRSGKKEGRFISHEHENAINRPAFLKQLLSVSYQL